MTLTLISWHKNCIQPNHKRVTNSGSTKPHRQENETNGSLGAEVEAGVAAPNSHAMTTSASDERRCTISGT